MGSRVFTKQRLGGSLVALFGALAAPPVFPFFHVRRVDFSAFPLHLVSGTPTTSIPQPDPSVQTLFSSD